MKRAFVGLLLLCVSACTPSSPVSTQKMSGIKTIGVVSAIGVHFQFQYVAPVYLFDRYGGGSVESWGIDDMVIDDASKLLRARYDVKPLKYDRRTFADVWDHTQLDELVRRQLSSQPRDAYVLITPEISVWGVTGRTLNGLGLISNGNPIAGYEDQIYALYKVTVVDGHSFTVIGSFGSTTGDDGIRIHGANKYVDHSLERRLSEKPSEALEELRVDIADLVKRSLPVTLRSVGLFN